MTDQSETTTGELVLRIRGTNRDGQLLRLRARKCTIGSGQNCTLRLASKNVAPLHCLILRGEGGTIVRRWDCNTRLNGQSFTDSELTPGDRLGIGPLEFEVVSLNDGGMIAPRNLPVSVSVPPPSVQADSRPDETRECNELMESLKAEKAALDLRNYQINQEVAALENEKDRLEREKNTFHEERKVFLAGRKYFFAAQDTAAIDRNALQAERDALAYLQRELHTDREAISSEKNCLDLERQKWGIEQNEYRNRQESTLADKSSEELNRVQLQKTELESQLHAFEEQKRRIQADWDEAERQHQSRLKQLDDREAALDAQAASLAISVEQSKAQADREEEFNKLREQFDMLQADLERRESEIGRRGEALQQQEAALQRERIDFQQNLDNLQQERARFQEEQTEFQCTLADFQKERESLELERQRWDEERSATAQAAEAEMSNDGDEPEAQSCEEDNPSKSAVDLQEILRRLGHNVDFPEEEAGEPQTSSTDSPRAFGSSSSGIGTHETPASQSESSAEDNELDSYMAQFMQRVGSKQPESDSVKPKSVERPGPSCPDQHVASSETSTDAESVGECDSQSREHVEMTPRAIAPEKLVNLSALRDLANLSAEQALGRHDLLQRKTTKRSKLIVTAVSLAAGAGLLWLWYVHNAGRLVVFAAEVSFLIALYWGLQYAIVSGRLIFNRSGGMTLQQRRQERIQKRDGVKQDVTGENLGGKAQANPDGTEPR